jgi:hypothetical protein
MATREHIPAVTLPPAPKCPSCGQPMIPVAGEWQEEWWLFWDCKNCFVHIPIPYSPSSARFSPDDLMLDGFWVTKLDADDIAEIQRNRERGSALALVSVALLCIGLAWLLAMGTVRPVAAPAPAVNLPIATTVAAAHGLAQAALASPAWAGGGGEFQVYAADLAVDAYALDAAAGIQIIMRADEHMVAKHGAETMAWLRTKPALEVWYRARSGDEAFCLLVGDPQSTMALGIFLGARGLGELPTAFDFTLIDHRLALTGWLMPLDRWHKRLPLQDYARVW